VGNLALYANQPIDSVLASPKSIVTNLHQRIEKKR
jgi:hypothetical protein